MAVNVPLACSSMILMAIIVTMAMAVAMTSTMILMTVVMPMAVTVAMPCFTLLCLDIHHVISSDAREF
jgi:hypothetical protein